MRDIAWLWFAQIYEVSDVSLTCLQLRYEIEIAFSENIKIADWITDRSGKVNAKRNSECIIVQEFSLSLLWLKFNLQIINAKRCLMIRCLIGECGLKMSEWHAMQFFHTLNILLWNEMQTKGKQKLQSKKLWTLNEILKFLITTERLAADTELNESRRWWWDRFGNCFWIAADFSECITPQH